MTADSSLGHVPYVHPSSIPGGINHLTNDDGFGGDNDEFLGRDNGQKLWETKYRFQKDMLPMFVGESFGRKVSHHNTSDISSVNCHQIFSTGKSLNFIRYSCLDSDWVVTREKMSNTGGSKSSVIVTTTLTNTSSSPTVWRHWGIGKINRYGISSR